ncbi:MAG: hypothetical protein ACLQVJ_05370 [Syntrophobacteraceae bacterium]
MTTVLIDKSHVLSLGSISCEADLIRKGGRFYINPPPSDRRCDCCGRHLSELKPYGKAGDPLVGDFENALLVKTWVAECGPYEDLDNLLEEYFGDCKNEEDANQAKAIIIEKYGEKKMEDLDFYMMLRGSVHSVRLCRDCVILDKPELYERLYPSDYTRVAHPKNER